MENFYNQRINVQSKFFLSVEQSMNFLIDIEAIPEEMTCNRCGRTMSLRIYREQTHETIIYRCIGCLKRVSVYSRCLLRRSHLPCTDVLFITYAYCIDLRINQIYNLVNLGEEAIIFMKKKIINCSKLLLEGSTQLLGGFDRFVKLMKWPFAGVN